METFKFIFKMQKCEIISDFISLSSFEKLSF